MENVLIVFGGCLSMASIAVVILSFLVINLNRRVEELESRIWSTKKQAREGA